MQLWCKWVVKEQITLTSIFLLSFLKRLVKHLNCYKECSEKVPCLQLNTEPTFSEKRERGHSEMLVWSLDCQAIHSQLYWPLE